MTPEKRIETQILNFLRMNDIYAWKNESTGVYDPVRKVFRTNHNPFKIKGTSDILGIYHGTFLAIEVKTAKTYPTADQKLFMENIRERGGIAFVARSIDDVIKELGLKP